MTETTQIQPWIIYLFLPIAILVTLVAIGLVIKRIWRSQDDEDIAL